MPKFILPAAVAAAVLATSLTAPAAFASYLKPTIGSQGIARGMVASWSPSNGILRLSDGSQYYVPDKVVANSGFTRGEMVKIDYRVLGVNDNVAHSVTPVEK